MKSLFLICGAIILTLTSQSFATDVSGDVWGVWTADNSPYNVVGSIRVPPDSSLVIEAGVDVQFCLECSLTVEGNATITASGTLNDSINFCGGGGVRLYTWSTNSAFDYCNFFNVEGLLIGAVRALNSNVQFTNCHFHHNTVIAGITNFAYGGALSIYNSVVTLENCLIDFNWARPLNEEAPQVFVLGGGIYVGNSIFSLTRCLISNNAAGGYRGIGLGGGIYLENTYAVLSGNTVTKNRSYYEDIENDTIYCGSGIFSSFSIGSVNSSIIWGNMVSDFYTYHDSLEITYSDIGDTIPGEGNIYSDPMFVDSINNDFHLLFGSPCINTGDPDSPLDPDSTRADMGALFYDFSTDIDEPSRLPEQFVLNQNYPNPFNAQTTISYSLSEASNVTMDIFDITGRKVSTLFEGQQSAGRHSLIWNAGNVVSGIYLCRAELDRFSAVRRLVLLR